MVPDHAEIEAPATVRQDAYILDSRVEAGATRDVPLRDGYDQWLYVFAGEVRLPDGTSLGEGGGIAASGPDRVAHLQAVADSDLVLFELKHRPEITLAGSLSRGR